MKRKSKHNSTGFTLVEILTTIAIIAILLGLLIPALTMVEKSAVKVKQKAQFHGIEISLETFSTDTGDYPPSAWNPAAYGNYTPSQRLAEAMVGRDGLGFHPDSRFRSDGKGDIDGDGILDPVAAGATLYNAIGGVAASSGAANDQTPAQNIAARKGPYLELESANAVMLSNLYGTANIGVLVDSYVLADMYKITKNTATGKMTGSPILYYRANRNKALHDASDPGNSTYHYYDAIGSPFAGDGDDSIVDLVPLSTHLGTHPMTPNMFYEQTRNLNFSNPARPYRSESFILQSAGPDSLYGTVDDVFNFDQGN